MEMTIRCLYGQYLEKLVDLCLYYCWFVVSWIQKTILYLKGYIFPTSQKCLNNCFKEFYGSPEIASVTLFSQRSNSHDNSHKWKRKTSYNCSLEKNKEYFTKLTGIAILNYAHITHSKLQNLLCPKFDEELNFTDQGEKTGNCK